MGVVFPRLPFGPLGLRALLRQRLLPGEGVVGWCVAQTPASISRALFQAAMAVVPGAGPAAAAVLSNNDMARLLLITDRQLLVVGPDRRGRGPVVTHRSGLGGLTARDGGAGRVELTLEDGRSLTLLVPVRGRGPSRLALAALEVLCNAGEGDPAQAVPAPALARSLYRPLLGPGPTDRMK